jgi:hypothetical protein
MSKLTLNDILDSRAYERVRDEFRSRVMEIKRRRRIHLGTIITLMFESRDTMQLQIQEMIRVEHINTDAGVEDELRAYNPLIPEPGQLCATMFIELTSDDQLREWLPKLAGIERAVEIQLGDGSIVIGHLDAQHEASLTRENVTAAVHYLYFDFTPEQVEEFAKGNCKVVISLPAYREEQYLLDSTVQELLGDLRQ